MTTHFVKKVKTVILVLYETFFSPYSFQAAMSQTPAETAKLPKEKRDNTDIRSPNNARVRVRVWVGGYVMIRVGSYVMIKVMIRVGGKVTIRAGGKVMIRVGGKVMVMIRVG
jgi:hypothetical protein